MRRYLALSLILGAALASPACKQELPKELNEPNVFGTVQETVTIQSEKVLIFQAGQDPYQQNWGTSTAYYVKVDDVMFPVVWDDAEKFKALKVGDKVNLHPSEFISCRGENDLKPTCHRMMRVYKSDRKINPLQTGG